MWRWYSVVKYPRDLKWREKDPQLKRNIRIAKYTKYMVKVEVLWSRYFERSIQICYLQKSLFFTVDSDGHSATQVLALLLMLQFVSGSLPVLASGLWDGRDGRDGHGQNQRQEIARKQGVAQLEVIDSEAQRGTSVVRLFVTWPPTWKHNNPRNHELHVEWVLPPGASFFISKHWNLNFLRCTEGLKVLFFCLPHDSCLVNLYHCDCENVFWNFSPNRRGSVCVQQHHAANPAGQFGRHLVRNGEKPLCLGHSAEFGDRWLQLDTQEKDFPIRPFVRGRHLPTG